MVGIISWGSYIPTYRIRTETIARVWGADPEEKLKSLCITEKAVPGFDEDTVTIAVEAARNAIRGAKVDPKLIGAVYIGSESHPYAVKPTGTIVAQAAGLSSNYTTADFEFACKAGTAAIQAGCAMVSSRQAKFALAGGSDTAQAAPGDPLEYTAAAGGAVFLLGNDTVAVHINDTVSFTTDTPDFWRRQHQSYPAHGGAFTGEPAYFRHSICATKRLMEKAGTSPQDYDHVIFHQPNIKFPTRLAKRMGFTDPQIQEGLLVASIGNAYSGSSLLGLAAVLDIAQAQDRILLTSYGSGAGSDSFDLTVTRQIAKVREHIIPVSYYMKKKKYLDYPRYLRNTGAL